MSDSKNEMPKFKWLEIPLVFSEKDSPTETISPILFRLDMINGISAGTLKDRCSVITPLGQNIVNLSYAALKELVLTENAKD